jgi:hypothetical protein
MNVSQQPVDFSESANLANYLLSDIDHVSHSFHPQPQPFKIKLFTSPRFEGSAARIHSFWSDPMQDQPCPDFVNFHNGTHSNSSADVSSRRRLQAKALTLDWLLSPKTASFTDRVLARLIQFEAHEVNAHLRDDYRQAFITLALAEKGSLIPFVEASYTMYGVHPDKVWPKMIAYRQWMLGPAKVLLPKKSAQPKFAEERKRA